MRKLFGLFGALLLGAALVGCETQTTTKRVESTVETPSGEAKKTVEQKVETTDDSTTKRTTEKVEKSGDSPPPTNP
jgi:hypothetical protein